MGQSVSCLHWTWVALHPSEKEEDRQRQRERWERKKGREREYHSPLAQETLQEHRNSWPEIILQEYFSCAFTQQIHWGNKVQQHKLHQFTLMSYREDIIMGFPHSHIQCFPSPFFLVRLLCHTLLGLCNWFWIVMKHFICHWPSVKSLTAFCSLTLPFSFSLTIHHSCLQNAVWQVHNNYLYDNMTNWKTKKEVGRSSPFVLISNMFWGFY